MNKQKKATLHLLLSITLLLTCSIFIKSAIQNTNYASLKQFKNEYHKKLWADYTQSKNPQKSLEMLTDLIKVNKYAYKELIKLLHKTGQNKKIIKLIPLLKTALPKALTDDPDIGFMAAYALVKQNVFINNRQMPITYNPKAMDILIPLNRKFPTHQKVAALASTLYDINKETKNALAISEKYLNSSATKRMDFLEYFKNANRYRILKEKDKALINIEKCLEIHPQFPQAWIFSASLKDQMEKTEEAMNDCKKALDLTGPNKAITLLLIKLFFKFKKSQHRLNEFVMNKQCFKKALQLFNTRQNDKALEYINKCLSKKLKNYQNKQNNLTVKVVS